MVVNTSLRDLSAKKSAPPPHFLGGRDPPYNPTLHLCQQQCAHLLSRNHEEENVLVVDSDAVH